MTKTADANSAYQEFGEDFVRHTMDGVNPDDPPPPSKARSRGIRVEMLAEFAAKNMERQELIEGLIGVGEFVVFGGDPKCGKSTVIGDAALHITANRKWFGRNVRHGAVLYIALEKIMPTKRRAKAFTLHHELDQSLPFAVMSGGALNFRDTLTAEIIANEIEKLAQRTGLPVVMVVIDTVNRAIGGNENKDADMGAFVATVGALQQTLPNLTVVAIHHLSKAGELRGHGALRGALEVYATIEKSEALRTLTIKEATEITDGSRLAFRFESVVIYTNPITGKQTSAPVVKPVEGIGTAAAKKKQPARQTRLALHYLNEAVVESGVVVTHRGIPPNTKVTTLGAWRDMCQQRNLVDSDNSSSLRTALHRAQRELQERQMIGVSDRYVWPARPESPF